MQHIFLKPVIQGAHQVGDAEEPSLDGSLLQLYAEALEQRYLAVERQVVGKLSDRKIRQCVRSGIALCKMFRGAVAVNILLSDLCMALWRMMTLTYVSGAVISRCSEVSTS